MSLQKTDVWRSMKGKVKKCIYQSKMEVNEQFERSLKLEYARVLHEGLLMPVLLYGSETMIWREKERSRSKAVQMDNLRGLLSIRRMDRVLNAQIRELCRVVKGVNERIDESVLCWLGHIERMGMGVCG